MEQLTGSDYDAEATLFLLLLGKTFRENGAPHIQVHRDVAQSLINENVGLEGMNRVLDERALELENEITVLKDDLVLLRIENTCYRKGPLKWLMNLRRLRLRFRHRSKSLNQFQERLLKSL